MSTQFELEARRNIAFDSSQYLHHGIYIKKTSDSGFVYIPKAHIVPGQIMHTKRIRTADGVDHAYNMHPNTLRDTCRLVFVDAPALVVETINGYLQVVSGSHVAVPDALEFKAAYCGAGGWYPTTYSNMLCVSTSVEWVPRFSSRGMLLGFSSTISFVASQE